MLVSLAGSSALLSVRPDSISFGRGSGAAANSTEECPHPEEVGSKFLCTESFVQILKENAVPTQDLDALELSSLGLLEAADQPSRHSQFYAGPERQDKAVSALSSA